MLHRSDGSLFAIGRCPYLNRPATDYDRYSRILVQVVVEGFTTLAVVDTGGTFLVCNPELSQLLGLDPRNALEPISLFLRGVSFPGHLHRVALTMRAMEGDSLQIEATAFVPEEAAYDLWPGLPPYLGLAGCLERLRFAIDPTPDQESFFFGQL